MLALAAYNGGRGQRRPLVARRAARNEDLTIEAIPFPETRKLRAARARRRGATTGSAYARELGI